MPLIISQPEYVPFDLFYSKVEISIEWWQFCSRYYFYYCLEKMRHSTVMIMCIKIPSFKVGKWFVKGLKFEMVKFIFFSNAFHPIETFFQPKAKKKKKKTLHQT